MTVITSNQIVRREFEGYPLPALPLGVWQGNVVLTSDASGGFTAATLIVNLAGAPRDPMFYSLEEVWLFSSDAAGSRVNDLQVTNLGAVLGQQNRHIALQSLITHNADISTLRSEGLGFLPMWLGRQQRLGTQTDLVVINANVDLAIITFGAGGYYWGPRSINVSGGPSRPISGLYSPR